jgi:protoporphyrinogen oxidase
LADFCFHDQGKILFGKVTRVRNAYPVYSCDYQENLEIVNDFLSEYKNLITAGRTGSFRYLNMDDCIKEGLAVAKRLG